MIILATSFMFFSMICGCWHILICITNFPRVLLRYTTICLRLGYWHMVNDNKHCQCLLILKVRFTMTDEKRTACACISVRFLRIFQRWGRHKKGPKPGPPPCNSNISNQLYLKDEIHCFFP